MRDLAQPLPVLVVAELLGLRAEDRHLLRVWSDGIAAGMLLGARRDAAGPLLEAHRCQQELIAYFRALIRQRQRKPQDDLISAMLAAQGNGGIASAEELLATCVLLLFAGHETTTNLIGNGVLARLDHPDQLERLSGNRHCSRPRWRSCCGSTARCRPLAGGPRWRWASAGGWSARMSF